MWRRKLNLLWLALARQSMLETEISVRGGPVAVWNAREQALREQNYLLLLKVRKDKRQQHMANCVVSDKSCLDVCNSLQLYRDKQGVHTTYKCIQVLHSICTKVLCLQFVQGRATHRGTNEPTWPMAQTPCSHGPNVTADVLYKTARLRVSGHLEPSGAIWSHLDSLLWILLRSKCRWSIAWSALPWWLDMARWLEQHPFWENDGSTSSDYFLFCGAWSQLQIKHNSELIWVSNTFTIFQSFTIFYSII
jgi:hypothetical protein